jgi:hypothetical protein
LSAADAVGQDRVIQASCKHIYCCFDVDEKKWHDIDFALFNIVATSLYSLALFLSLIVPPILRYLSFLDSPTANAG